MINAKRVMALIPARGGSKGIKGKNIVMLEGKPLIAYSIEAALATRYIDEVYVSTESEEIAKIAIEFGAKVPFLRPSELALDTSRTVDVVCHFLNAMSSMGEKFDILVLLQPTGPLRTSEDIEHALAVFYNNDYQSVVSVSEVDEHPILMRRINEDGEMRKIWDANSTVRRQDMEKIYKVNGSIYINDVKEINPNTSFNDNKIPFIMSKQNSVDIDEYVDLAVAKYYLSERGKV